MADEALSARVVKALEDDPYVYTAHMSVVTENGIVRLQGIALDAGDLYRSLYLARRIAGKRRVVNEMEMITWGADLNRPGASAAPAARVAVLYMTIRKAWRS